MPTCRICLRVYAQVRYQSARMTICGRCVNTLNDSPEVAQEARKRIAEMLERGMVRRALAGLESPEVAVRNRARWTLDHLAIERERALPRWLTKKLKAPATNGRDFKMMRAYRLGLLHFDRPRRWGYPSNWPEVASTIRRLDGYRCVACGSADHVLDVHHIVYVSHFGTHQKPNLITLCRPCHVAEHERRLDIGEAALGAADGETLTVMPYGAPSDNADVRKLISTTRSPQHEPSATSVQVLSDAQPAHRPEEAGNVAGVSPISELAPQAGGRERAKRVAETVGKANLQRSARARDPSLHPERYCGYCRSLVMPVRRLLFLRSCPRCGADL